AFDGAQKSPAQAIANRGSPTALERLRGKFSVLIRECFRFSGQPLWFLEALPHFYYSSRSARGRPTNQINKSNFRKCDPGKSSLLRIKFDDQLLVHRRCLHVFTPRQCDHARLEMLAVDIEPWRDALALREVARFENHRVLVHLVFENHIVADRDEVARDIDLVTLHVNVAVKHELARLGPRGAKPHAVDDVVETALEHDDK